jgi:hypothetical protein
MQSSEREAWSSRGVPVHSRRKPAPRLMAVLYVRPFSSKRLEWAHVSLVHVWKPALLSRLAANVTPCWSTVPELRKNDDLWVSGVLHEHGVHRMRISSGWLFKTVHTFHSEWGLHNINLRNLTVGIVALQAFPPLRGAQRIDFRASAGCGSKGA